MSAGPPGPLGPDDVHVWLASLTASPTDLERFAESLSAEERRRAERLRAADARARFIAARGIARRLLGSYLDEPANRLRFAYGPMGQPMLASQPAGLDLRFNLSHSGDLLLLAIAKARAVGIDLEPVRRLTHREAVERRVFSAEERRALYALPADRRLEAFFNGWTRKEAFAKAVGDGMWASMGRVEVTLDPRLPARLVRLDGSTEAAAAWSVFHLEPASGFVGAAAVEGRHVCLSQHGISLEASRR